MGTSEVPKPESSARSRAWSNPYKFRLWFSNYNTNLFTEKQKQMVYHFLGWGRKGCDSWNYKLMLDLHCSRRTLQLNLRHLEKHALVDIRGALGKHRRIIVIPYPNQATWMQISLQQTSQKLGEFLSNTGPNRGAKFCAHQRRTSKTSINQQLDGLLYGESFLRLRGGGSSETSASDIPYEEAQVWEQTRRKMIDELVWRGHPRETAINMANITVRISIRQKQAFKKKTPGLPNPARP
ncbi:hypothetical protein ES703_99590 [subsurface metagenome]